MPYRRPTSPLTYEPLCPSPSDVLLEESESETDDQSRAAKRRRIEAIGEAYLAGEHPFILTASLRGPFDSSWNNPWRRKREEIPNTAQKVPTMVSLSSKPVDRTLQYDGQRTCSPISVFNDFNDPLKPVAFFNAPNNVMSRRPVAGHSFQPEKDWLRRDNLYLRQQPDQRQRTPSPTPLRPPGTRDHQSPNAATTTSPRAPNTVVRPGLEPPTAPPRSPSKLHNAVKAFLSPPKRPGVLREPEKIEVVIDVPRSTPNSSNDGLETFLKSRNRPNLQPGNPLTHEGSMSVSKANSSKAIGHMKRREVQAMDLGIPRAHKRRSLHKAPPSTNLEEFEYRPAVAKRRKTDLVPLELDHRASEPSAAATKPAEFKKPKKRVSFRSSPTSPKATRKEQPEFKEALHEPDIRAPSPSPVEEVKKVQRPDVLRVAASISSSTGFSPVSANPEATGSTESSTHLPSAQVQEDFLIPPPPENLSTEPIESELLLLPTADEDPSEDSILELSTQAAVARAHERFQADLWTPLKPTSAQPTSEAMQTPLETTIGPSSKAPETAEKQSTQALLDAMTPFNFSTAKRIKRTTSTPSYANTKISNLKLQATHTKRTPSLPRNTSLSKIISQTPSHPPLFPTKHLSLDMSTSPEPEVPLEPLSPSSTSSPSRYESAHSTSSKVPMAPPSTTSTSTHTLDSQASHPASDPSHQPSTSRAPTGTANTASTTPHQDAQPQVRLVLDLRDMPYDLDETMEDIGSFLGGWDVERDMRGSAVP